MSGSRSAGDDRRAGEPPAARDRGPGSPRRAPLPGQATRGQRVALVVGLLVVAWLALQLFASVLAPFVAAGRHRLCARPADHAADPVRPRPRAGGAADDPGTARRRAAVRPAALPADPAADRPAARPHPAIRPVAAALGERGDHRPAAEFRLRRGERQAARPGQRSGRQHADLHRLLADQRDRRRIRDLQRADARRGDAGGGLLPAARLAAGDRAWSIPGCRTATPM